MYIPYPPDAGSHEDAGETPGLQRVGQHHGARRNPPPQRGGVHQGRKGRPRHQHPRGLLTFFFVLFFVSQVIFEWFFDRLGPIWLFLAMLSLFWVVFIRHRVKDRCKLNRKQFLYNYCVLFGSFRVILAHFRPVFVLFWILVQVLIACDTL